MTTAEGESNGRRGRGRKMAGSKGNVLGKRGMEGGREGCTTDICFIF
jgi:hypothetical protein